MVARAVIHLDHRSGRIATKPFTPTAPKCPSCQKSVYAAEQVLGPGATPYHKICLKCTDCQKILDPFKILEHGYDPYCKICHSKNFGTKGVGYGNAVVGEYGPKAPPSNPASPTLVGNKSLVSSSTTFSTSSPSALIDPSPSTSKTNQPNSPQQSGRSQLVELDSPTRTANPGLSKTLECLSIRDDGDERTNEEDFEPPSLSNLEIVIKARPKPTEEDHRPIESSSEAIRTPISSLRSQSSAISQPSPRSHIWTPPPKPSKPIGLVARAQSGSPYHPRAPNFAGSPVGSDGPQKCPACHQTVYHAEQVLAIGKKWHKRCLRCCNCKKALDASLTERDGQPYCTKCYDNHFGTAAHGFVLRPGFAAR